MKRTLSILLLLLSINIIAKEELRHPEFLEEEACFNEKINKYTVREIFTLVNQDTWSLSCDHNDFSVWKKALTKKSEISPFDWKKLNLDLCGPNLKINIERNEWCDPDDGFICPTCEIVGHKYIYGKKWKVHYEKELKKRNAKNKSFIKQRHELIEIIFKD